MTNSHIVDYVTWGLASARPSTPAGDSTAASFYYATDTGVLSVYASGSWHNVTAASTDPAVVQQKAVVNSNSVTLGSTPVQNNLLLAITDDPGVSETANTGWTKISFVSAAQDGVGFFWKTAGASESTTQQPITGTLSTGSTTVFEISNATPAALFANNVDLSGTAIAASITAAKAKLIVGAATNRTSTGPTSITGATNLGSTVSGGSRAVQPFKITSPAIGSNTVTANYATSQGATIPMIEIG